MPTVPRPGVTSMVRALRARFVALGDPERAAFHRGYHKTDVPAHGVPVPALRAAVREAFPTRRRLEVEEACALARALWETGWFEERTAALLLLERVASRLRLGDLPMLKRFAREADGWALLDLLATKVLGRLALARGEPVYRAVAGWRTHRVKWVRRASVLIHLLPGRQGCLSASHAWTTFEALLPDPDFFLRKAIGWTLRECAKADPEAVVAFLERVGERDAPLTRREASRNLPERLRRRLG